MTDLQKMLAKKMKQNAKAKADSISSKMKNGIAEYLINWLRDFQKDYASSKTDLERQMLMKQRSDEAYYLVAQIDKNANIELKWNSIDNTGKLNDLGVDGICVHWSPIGQQSQNQDQLLIDSSTLLMREIGVE
jgi:hypothetical protein